MKVFTNPQCQISKQCVFILVFGPQKSYQKCHHSSTVEFVEQNFHFPILSRNLMAGTLRTQNFRILSAPLSFKYKIDEQKCNQFCSTVKYIKQK
jgi:hypothetical protein